MKYQSKVITIDFLKIELPPGVPRAPKKASSLVDLRNSEPKPRREKKVSIEEPRITEDKTPDADAEILQAVLSKNQVETSSKRPVSSVVLNRVSQDGGKAGQDSGEVQGRKNGAEEQVGGKQEILADGREEIRPRSTPFRSRQVCLSHHQILVGICVSVCQFLKH